jgi:hypothetical protein
VTKDISEGAILGARPLLTALFLIFG